MPHCVIHSVARYTVTAITAMNNAVRRTQQTETPPTIPMSPNITKMWWTLLNTGWQLCNNDNIVNNGNGNQEPRKQEANPMLCYKR
jgi:hypothetical protein